MSEAELSINTRNTNVVDETAVSQPLQSTHGFASTTFRETMPVVRIVSTEDGNAVSPGKLLFRVDLDGRHNTLTTDIIESHMLWRYDFIKLTMVQTGPFANASGSGQTAVNKDPEDTLPADPTELLAKAMALNDSKQFNAKTSMEIIPDLSPFGPLQGTWIYSRAGTAGLRASSRGYVFGCVRTAPVIGDGALYALTIEGTIQAKDPTRFTVGVTLARSAVTLRANVGDIPMSFNSGKAIKIPVEVTEGVAVEGAFYVYTTNPGIIIRSIEQSESDPTTDLLTDFFVPIMNPSVVSNVNGQYYITVPYDMTYNFPDDPQLVVQQTSNFSGFVVTETGDGLRHNGIPISSMPVATPAISHMERKIRRSFFHRMLASMGLSDE